jgi:hypothetical protein
LEEGRPAWLDNPDSLASLFAHLLEAQLLVPESGRLDFISIPPGRTIFRGYISNKVVHFVLLKLKQILCSSDILFAIDEASQLKHQ